MSPCHLVILSSLLLLTSCTSIRPIAKIGLIAPFEGLHRRNGYEALDAMRLAIADAGDVGIDFIPLALDDSVDPLRTAQKMMADPSLRAIIGPLTPQALSQVSSVFSSTNSKNTISWLVPFVLSPTEGFINPTLDSTHDATDDATLNSMWAINLLDVVVESVHRQGKDRLVLAGWRPGWPALTAAEWSKRLGIEIVVGNEPTAIPTGASLFWLGDAETGARFVSQLQALDSTVEVWLGPAGGDPIFGELAQLRKPVYWAIWSQPEYNTVALSHPNLTPSSYLIYRATLQAIAQVAEQNSRQERSSGTSMPWLIQCFALLQDGTRVTLNGCNPQ